MKLPAALTAALLGAAALTTTIPATAGTASAGQAQPDAITLITGDRVTVGADGKVEDIRPGPDRNGISFMTRRDHRATYVIPSDARALLDRGALDRRLFDVAGLQRLGYDDAHTPTLPLILSNIQGAAANPALRSAGVAVTGELPLVRGAGASAKKSELGAVWKALTASDAAVGKIWLDGVSTLTLDRSTAQIGAPAAWAAELTGTGVKVAVLDTGVDDKHPDLVGRVVAAKNFTTDTEDSDNLGHGTHVAATIASTGAKEGGKYKGVAPGASLLAGKVCMRDASGRGTCTDSAQLAGIEWAVAQGARIVNMSLGAPDTPGLDPIEEAVNTASKEKNVLFVVSAGNSGEYGAETIGSPGSAAAALTVGAVDRDDTMAAFSSRGPVVGAEGTIKPDITAPGVGIVAAKASKGSMGNPAGDGYVSMSGTSMAAPHIAGAAALLAQQHPDWTGAQLKAALMAGAKHSPDATPFDEGAGRVDVAAAIGQHVTADAPTVSLGRIVYPHGASHVVDKDVVYRNTGTAPVTLDLTVTANGPDGTPAKVFTVSPASITIAPNSTATAALAADVGGEISDGIYAGALVASGSGQNVRTPVSVYREGESYDLTVNVLGRDGKPAPDTSMLWMGSTVADDLTVVPKMRLPKGTYALGGSLPDADGTDDLLFYPNLELTKDTTITLDAREAKPVRIVGPVPLAEQAWGMVMTERMWPDGTGFGVTNSGVGVLDRVRTARFGPTPPKGQSTALISLDGSPAAKPAGPPLNYHFRLPLADGLPTGFTRTIRRSELAEVRTAIGPAPVGSTGELALRYIANGRSFNSQSVAVTAPGSAIDLVTTETQWAVQFSQTSGTGRHWEETEFKTLRPNSTYHERANFGIFSPSLAKDVQSLRGGNSIRAYIPLFTGSWATGTSEGATGRTTLLRDGKKVGESNLPGNAVFTDLPADRATYTLETEAEQSALSELSTKVSARWTFTSAQPDGEARVVLPLSVVRFNAKLSDTNSAPGGRTLDLPLSVRQQGDAGTITQFEYEVEASFDDGATWKFVPVSRGVARVSNPAKAGFASLRVKATDSKGNTTETTVIRAYKVA